MIRVLRVLEYEYPNGEAYVRDQARWMMRLPLHQYGVGGMRMQSSVVSITSIDEPLPVSADPAQEVEG